MNQDSVPNRLAAKAYIRGAPKLPLAAETNSNPASRNPSPLQTMNNKYSALDTDNLLYNIAMSPRQIASNARQEQT